MAIQGFPECWLDPWTSEFQTDYSGANEEGGGGGGPPPPHLPLCLKLSEDFKEVLVKSVF